MLEPPGPQNGALGLPSAVWSLMWTSPVEKRSARAGHWGVREDAERQAVGYAVASPGHWPGPDVAAAMPESSR